VGGNRAGRPSAYELTRRKTRIFDIASAMFAARGYSDTTILDIADEAGVAPLTVRMHFGEKPELFRKILLEPSGDVFALMPLGTGADLRGSLVNVAHQLIAALSSDQFVARLRLAIAEGLRFPEISNHAGSALVRPLHDGLREMFGELAARGLIADGDHKASAELFLNIFLGGAVLATFFGYGDPFCDEVIERQIELFLEGRFRRSGHRIGPRSR
jgi:TetR/AcrR family transcriptional repressor of mexJK operon